LKQAVSRLGFLFAFAAYPVSSPTAMDAPISANTERFQDLFNNVPAVAPLNAVRGTAGTWGLGRGHLSCLSVGAWPVSQGYAGQPASADI
jgi:hypothetical protein